MLWTEKTYIALPSFLVRDLQMGPHCYLPKQQCLGKQ